MTRATATTAWVTMAWSLPTPRAGSCSEPRQEPVTGQEQAVGEPRDRPGQPAAGRVPESDRPGRAARRRVGPDRRQDASRPGAGVVRLSRTGPALAVDGVCPGRVGDVRDRGRPGPGSRLAA